ncbi:uncharacterized protein LOC121380232 isoform X2 [Gigantopelta aegis]|nr:uncharacterized protein LOC121380232 isoform X2 [Gigantopelta aegis]
MSQPANNETWEKFLMPLFSYQCRRPRCEKKIDKDSLVGPSSISYNFGSRIDLQSGNKTSKKTHENDEQKEAFDDDDDDSVIIIHDTTNVDITTKEPLDLISPYTSGSDDNIVSSATTVPSNSNTIQTKKIQKRSTKRAVNDNIVDNVASKYRKTDIGSTKVEQSRAENSDSSKENKSGFLNIFKSWFTSGQVPSPSSGISTSDSVLLKAGLPKQKLQMRPIMPIDHRAKTLTKWDFWMFSSLVNFEDDVERLMVQTKSLDVSVASEEMNTAIEESLHLLQTSHTQPVLEDVLYKQSHVRILLTAILQKVRMRLKFGIKTEEQVDLKHLPNCKFDFLFHTHDGKPIGCMEAKTSSGMNNRAFAQATIQLLVLQQLACKHDVDISTVPVFNILTDGQRFVLMQVKGDKLYLEHVSKNGEEVLNIRTTQVMESLFNLFEMTLNCMP